MRRAHKFNPKMIQQVQLKDVKKGDFFRFKQQETAPLWVRDEYDRSSKTFCVHAYDDVNRFLNRKPTVKVFVEIY